MPGDPLQGGRVGLGQEPLVLEVLEGGGVLGIDDVGRGAGPFGDDLVGQDVLIVAANVHGYPRGLLEPGDQRSGRLHVLAVVESDRDRAGAEAGDVPPQAVKVLTLTSAAATQAQRCLVEDGPLWGFMGPTPGRCW